MAPGPWAPGPGAAPEQPEEAPRGRGRGGGGSGGPGPSWRACSLPTEQSPQAEPKPLRRAPIPLQPPLWTPLRVPAFRAGASAAVRRVTARAPPQGGWGLGLQLPEREEKGEVKGEGPPEVPPPQCGRGRRRGRSPRAPPRRGWCVPDDVRSSPPLPGWCALSDVRCRGRSCPSAPKAAGGIRAWGRCSGAARAPAPASFTSPGPVRVSGRRRTGVPAGVGGGAAAPPCRERCLRPSSPLAHTTDLSQTSVSWGLRCPATPGPPAPAQPLWLRSSVRLQPR